MLDPIDRISEVLFGLIMVLTFTGSLSVVDAGRDDVRTMLIGALGCNLAWGTIDGVLFLMGCLAEREGNLRTLHAVRRADESQAARRLIAEALPAVIASVLEPRELDAIHERLLRVPEPPDRVHLSRSDWLGGFAVFLLVFLSTFPVLLPFVFMESVGPAMRVSNGIAVVMLFATGYAFGRCTSRNAWLTGTAMLLIGVVLVALTMALGG